MFCKPKTQGRTFIFLRKNRASFPFVKHFRKFSSFWKPKIDFRQGIDFCQRTQPDPRSGFNCDVFSTFRYNFLTERCSSEIPLEKRPYKIAFASLNTYQHLANHTRNSRCSHKLVQSSMLDNAWRRYISDDSSSSPWPCRSDECDAEGIGVAHGEQLPPIAVSLFIFVLY